MNKLYIKILISLGIVVVFLLITGSLISRCSTNKILKEKQKKSLKIIKENNKVEVKKEKKLKEFKKETKKTSLEFKKIKANSKEVKDIPYPADKDLIKLLNEKNRIYSK